MLSVFNAAMKSISLCRLHCTVPYIFFFFGVSLPVFFVFIPLVLPISFSSVCKRERERVLLSHSCFYESCSHLGKAACDLGNKRACRSV